MPNDYDSVDWMGRKFNHLMIIGYDKKRDGGFRCVCDCGKIISVRPNKLLKSQVVSCGKCDIRLGIKQHGISTLGLRLDNIWKGMIQRCYNPNSSNYMYYGSRGISVCEEWRSNELAFLEWALNNGYRNDLTIDRIDVNGNYEPSNCRWATYQEQNNNKNPAWTFTQKYHWKKTKVKTGEINGVRKSVDEWCAEYGVSRPFIDYRLKKKGMSLYDALTQPKLTDGRPRKEVL